MPNHVSNFLTVHGPKEDLARFKYVVDSNSNHMKAYDIMRLTADVERLTKDLHTNVYPYLRTQLEEAKELLGKLKAGLVVEDASPLRFEGTVPMPEELEGISAPAPDDEDSQQRVRMFGAKDWYGWKIKFWGTKWGAYDANREERANGAELFYRFSTAWSAPTEWLLGTSKVFPTLSFELTSADPAMDWYLQFKIRNGNKLRETELSMEEYASEWDPGLLETDEEEVA